MKTVLMVVAAVVVIGMSLLAAGAADAPARPRGDLWKAVEEAMQKGLPQTAITNLQKIIPAARDEKAYPEMVKAIAQMIALEGNIQGNKPEERITRMEAELSKTPEEARPVMQALLANWYWHYFQQNRWRFMQRTATAEAPGKDFTTWDLRRLFEEIDRHFQIALGEKSIRKVPVEAWDGLLEKGTMPESYRPTLYDFLAHDALEFYVSGEQVAARPQGAFELKAESPVFEGPEAFVQWKPWEGEGKADTNAAAIKAIRLFQELLRFHEADEAPRPAYAHVDLERLTWGFNAAAGDTKGERYKKALSEFVERNADEAISALALERHARVLQGQGELVAARKLAQRGAEAYPDSVGGKLCRNLVVEIGARNLSITTERIWNAPWPKITARYRNMDRLYFRAIPFEWEKVLSKARWSRVGQLDEEQRKQLLQMEPALSWDVALPPTPDYKERVFAAQAPESLKKGYYFIVASGSKDFSEANNMVFACDVWVSDLALVMRSREGRVEGFVLKAYSGEPVANAIVEPWRRGQDGGRVHEPDVRTDDEGFFTVSSSGNYIQYVLRARSDGDAVGSTDDIYGYERRQPNRNLDRVLFFTDRSIYRPGQTVQYKGLALIVDQEKDNYQVNSNRQVTVIFQDPNGKEITRKTHKANVYGSFSGSFTAPRDRLMGQMTIRSEANDGSTWVRVEEYKRPKFEVTLDQPTEAPRLNGKVVMNGRALAYTGAAIDGAQITYRVVRRVQMPWWWGWWRGGGYSQNEQEIANGTLTTKTDGSFQLEFDAKPDISISETNEPSFVFNANVDVTDGSGETRSANQSVRVGYTALEARMTAEQWLTKDAPVVVSVNATTLDGKPQVAEGSIKVHRLKGPSSVQRQIIGGRDDNSDGLPDDDMSTTDRWPLGEVVTEQGFTTDTNGIGKVSIKLPAGAFRAVLETRDRFGKVVTGLLPLQVLDPESDAFGIRIPFLVAAPRWELQPGDEFMALWGTGYEEGRAFIEIEQRGRITQRFWTAPGKTQQQVRLQVTEAMRGGFTLHVLQVRENRILHQTMNVSVPWKNKELHLKWEHFVSKLQPGKEETWTAVISKPEVAGKNGSAFDTRLAEMVATLYDESLDAFSGHNWPVNFNVFRHSYSSFSYTFANGPEGFNHILGSWNHPYQHVELRYRRFPLELSDRMWGYAWFGRGSGGSLTRFARREAVALYDSDGPAALAATPAPTTAAVAGEALYFNGVDKLEVAKAKRMNGPAQAGDLALGIGDEQSGGAGVDLGMVQARKNLNETAFFFPHLTADSNGVVKMTFTMPEALTRWKFMGIAHDTSVRNGYIEEHAVTSKDLMVQPNPPRFLREGDQIEFTVKVSNQSDTVQRGSVRLTFALAATGEAADALLGNKQTDQAFMIPAKESRSFSWKIQVPDGCGFLSYKAVASTSAISDGEEAAIPVLSRRVFVTESLPLPIRGPATKDFTFEKLVKSRDSKTLEHESYTVQMVSNPAWYAVMALPYLMEFPHECAEQVFNRLYANALARDIANRDPKIRRIFDLWKNTAALDSPLEKNQDLKSVMLEETPWVRQALAESGARKNIGILFDGNRLDSEMEAVQQKLREMQIGNGQWPWFPGGPGDDYITLYIVTGFGRLRHLGVDMDVQLAIRALQSLDQWMNEEYQRIMRSPDPEAYVPSPRVALYLYGRSFFLKDRPVARNHDKPLQFFLQRSREHWLKTGNRQSQGHLALALQRFAKQANVEESVPKAITASLRERSVTNEELGTFWRDLELSWWWFRAPIETQALMIEVFDEIDADAKMVEDCKVWLLKQKQTQDWKTTKATADAVYALLLRGRDLLASDALVQVKIGDKQITPKAAGSAPVSAGKADRFSPVVEPGTGFYEVRLNGREITPAMGKITVKKTDAGVAWGSAHWQYFEDISKVTPHEGTPLKLTKSLYIKKNTAAGPVLEPVKGAVAVGDELVVRIELRTDRDMEYVHMKDQRGSGTEPVNVLSRYKYQDGLGYYESTRDTASHFFISYLPKGVYVFEYSTRVQLRGAYQTGIAEIQCMYAPEFNSHSQSLPLTVK